MQYFPFFLISSIVATLSGSVGCGYALRGRHACHKYIIGMCALSVGLALHVFACLFKAYPLIIVTCKLQATPIKVTNFWIFFSNLP